MHRLIRRVPYEPVPGKRYGRQELRQMAPFAWLEESHRYSVSVRFLTERGAARLIGVLQASPFAESVYGLDIFSPSSSGTYHRLSFETLLDGSRRGNVQKDALVQYIKDNLEDEDLLADYTLDQPQLDARLVMSCVNETDTGVVVRNVRDADTARSIDRRITRAVYGCREVRIGREPRGTYAIVVTVERRHGHELGEAWLKVMELVRADELVAP
jgi:hypothetical protein